MKKNVLFVTGTRADYGLLKPVIKGVSKSKKLHYRFLATGMHTLKTHGLTYKEIINDGLSIDYIVNIKQQNDMLGWLNEEILGIRNYCLRNKPDLILVLGDRDEALAGAIVGSHLGIPIGHIHGGDITGPVTVDNRIRDAITSFSTYHFPINKSSASRVKQILGNKKMNHIVVIGSIASEGIIKNKNSKEEIYKRYKLNNKLPLILVVLHPTPLENIKFMDQIKPVITALKHFKANIVIIYPNSDTGNTIFIKKIKSEKLFIHQFRSLKREIYLGILASCNVLVGNSSSGPLEAPLFSTPVVNIGKRQEGRNKYKYMITVDYDYDKIRHAIAKQLSLKISKKINIQKVKKPSQIIVNYLENNLLL